MKILILFLVSTFAFASDAVDKAEDSFVKREAEYKKEYNDKVERLTLAYIKRLEQIQKETVQKGDLDGALKVKNKIKSLSATHGSIIGKWNWGADKTVNFNDDGSAKGSLGAKGIWKKINNSYEVKWDNGKNKYTSIYVLSKDGKTLLKENKVVGTK